MRDGVAGAVRTVAILGSSILLIAQYPREVIAFNSYPPGAPHDVITRAAAESFGLSKDATARLMNAVRRPDRREHSWSPSWSPRTWLRFRGNHKYDPAHHFDRLPKTSDAMAFRNGAHYVRASLDLVAEHARAQRFEDSLDYLGRAIHAAQDLCSHSNLVDFSQEDVDRVFAAVLTEKFSPPAPLRLTAYDPTSDDPESPVGDSYDHRSYAKDSSGKNSESRAQANGQTKVGAAKGLGERITVDLLRSLHSSLTKKQWGALFP